MKTLEEAVKIQGVSLLDDGLRVHFSPIPNWYGCFTGFDCPRCNQSIDWKWVNGKLPSITNPASIQASGVEPEVTGAILNSWGHRWIRLSCNGCSSVIRADNFD